jgi:hypothetical protein
MYDIRRTVVSVGMVILAVGASAYVGCGDDSTVTGGGEGGSDGGIDGTKPDSTTGGDSGGSGDSIATGDSTGNGDSMGSGDVANDSPSEGAVGDGGPGSDAPADVALVMDSGGPLSDASPGGDAATLNCGFVNCDLPTQTCCLYPIVSPPPPFYAACSNGASCPALAPDSGYDAGAATELQCEVQDNCPANNVCCLEAPASGVIHAHCLSPNSCVGVDGGSRAMICDPSLADGGCGEAGACSSANINTWNLPSGFGTCGGVSR